jgi:hypothetical protein
VPNLKLQELLLRWLLLPIKELTFVKKILENWAMFDEDEQIVSPLVCWVNETSG